MLLIPVFHRVGRGKWATELSILKRTLYHLKRYPHVLPGEKLQRGCNICLTFDDATCDFYYFVYPLLKELNLRALLAVPTAYILEKSEVSWEERLDFQDPFCSKNHFCTAEELYEMEKSGHVQLASHTHTHPDLTKLSNEKIEEELTLSAKLLRNPNTLIYPFGKMDRKVQRIAKKHYPYCMRLGGGTNFSWNSLLYRIPMDGGGQLRPNPKQFFNFFKNRLRAR
ncbi:MAG: polysaccharide deacetylase family protein [Candidatus Algichlamydia australiensis]|nr:polysaccharide deacetylase family protein [Chlamydiales bacterium]